MRVQVTAIPMKLGWFICSERVRDKIWSKKTENESECEVVASPNYLPYPVTSLPNTLNNQTKKTVMWQKMTKKIEFAKGMCEGCTISTDEASLSNK